ncbi:MAG: hypothetical protein IBX55_10255 [Methyloprofundus sp.]|nr:hypothetical protein [Methyloprofundus sp.]MBW6452556.1 hypothetical protein [Methyloprofundus sp.]
MFIYSLPIFFTYIQLGTPLDLLLIALLIYLVIYLTLPFIAASQERECVPLNGLSFYKYLLYCWLGSLKLWVVFWPFFILLNSSLYVTDMLAMQGNFTVSSWDEVHFILLTPAIFWALCVWRNSTHTKSRLSAAGARFMTLAVFFEYALKLVIRDDYPRIFFACQDIMLDYASCF